MDSRPIRPSPSGQYDLSFIDWNNEWESHLDDPPVHESLFTPPNPPKELIDSLRPCPYSEKLAACSICLTEAARAEKGYILDCGHWFHAPCLEGWLRMKLSCPNCRFPLIDPRADSGSERSNGNEAEM